jgi:folate-binding protein YgfZ
VTFGTPFVVTDGGPTLTPVDERVIEVTGSDRTTFLEATTTQKFVTGGESAPTHGGRPSVPSSNGALVLDANGTPIAVFETVVLTDRFLLLAPDDAVAATIMDVLAGRTFLAEVRFEPREDRVLLVHGEGASTAARALVDASDAAVLVVQDDAGAIRLVAEPAAVEAVLAIAGQVGVRVGTERDVEDWRIAQGVPRWGREIAAPHLPEELGLLPTHVHLAKGCYPGQEAVARMWMLGRPRRRLASMRVEGAVVPGWQVGEGREQVVVTSVSLRHRMALGFVPGTAGVGSTFEDGRGASVEVVRLPGEDRTPPGHDPAMIRRRDRDAALPVMRVRRPES